MARRPLGTRDLFAAGGKMGERMRAFDWSATPIGPPRDWPPSLRAAVRLLLNSRHPMFIWWGPALIQLYNDAFAAIIGPERHPSALGQPGRDCWQEVWPLIGPQIEQVMADQGATWNEDERLPLTRHGRRQDVYWTYGCSPIEDAAQPQGVGGVLAVCRDVTQENETRRALLRSQETLQLALEAAGVVGIWEWELATGLVVTDEHVAALYGLDPALAAVGAPLKQLLLPVPEEDRPGLQAALARSLAAGASLDHEYRLRRPDGRLRWIAAHGRCRLDEAGRPLRLIGTVVDITARKRAEARQALLAREMTHRAKNALAVVQAALRLTTAPDQPSYVRAVEGRVGALARAQTLLAEDGWVGADLGALLRVELQPFLAGAADRERRATMEGPAVLLPAAATQPLGMAVHELATNAVKYGALSTPGGQVAISWVVQAGSAQVGQSGLLRLRWAETGGPAPAPAPGRRGFGSRVIEVTVRGQLGGTVKFDWQATGLVCDMTVPLAATEPANAEWDEPSAS